MKEKFNIYDFEFSVESHIETHNRESAGKILGELVDFLHDYDCTSWAHLLCSSAIITATKEGMEDAQFQHLAARLKDRRDRNWGEGKKFVYPEMIRQWKFESNLAGVLFRTLEFFNESMSYTKDSNEVAHAFVNFLKELNGGVERKKSFYEQIVYNIEYFIWWFIFHTLKLFGMEDALRIFGDL